MKSFQAMELPVPPLSPTSDDPYFEARQSVVQRINQDRAAAGLGPVELDGFASQVEDRHCQEMAGRAYLSHWNLQGLLPYHRYHFAGGRDHVQENLSRATVFSIDPSPIPTAPPQVLPYLLGAHERFMEEQPPLDGHRKTVLDPGHTHVGIGLAVAGGEFTMGELFVNRYVRLQALPEIVPGGAVRVEGEMLRSDFGPYYAALFSEGFPQPRTVAELERTYAYEDMSGEICVRVPPWEMWFDRSRGRFRFTLPMKPCDPGYYHLVLWVRQPVRSIPYELSGAGSYQVDTKLAVPCAGWLFRTEP